MIDVCRHGGRRGEVFSTASSWCLKDLYGGPLRRFATPEAAVMLKLESARHPMHIASLQVFSPPPAAGADFAQQIYAAMLECTDVARVFRGHPKISRRGTSPVQWAYDERVDLGDHLKLVSLPAPG